MITYVMLRCRACAYEMPLTAQEIAERKRIAKEEVTADLIQKVAPSFVCSKCGSRHVRFSIDRPLPETRKSPTGKPVGRGGSSRLHRLIEAMLANPTWLSGRDQKFLLSLYTQRKFSDKQARAIRYVHERYSRNQGPRFFRG